MFELQPQNFRTTEPLLHNIHYDIPIMYAVLQHSSPGRIWGDDRESPSIAFICPSGTFHYIAGQSDRKDGLQAVWKLLHNQLLPEIENPADREIVLFALSEDWHAPLQTFIKEQKGITITRKTFQFHPEQFRTQRNWRDRLPDGFSMRFIDAEILAQGALHDTKLDTWNSPEAFLSKGAGAYLWHNEQVVSEASTVFVGHGIAEPGVHTAEQYCGQG